MLSKRWDESFDPTPPPTLVANVSMGAYPAIAPGGNRLAFVDSAYDIDIWQAELGLGWSQRDIADVQAYLNWLYYGYPHSLMVPWPQP